MVEKISEVSVKLALKSDSSADDAAFFKRIKKKKQDNPRGDSPMPVVLLPPDIQVQLINTQSQGGSITHTQKQPRKHDISAITVQTADFGKTQKDVTQRGQRGLVAPGQAVMPNTPEKTVAAMKNSLPKTAGGAESAMAQKTEPMLIASAESVMAQKSEPMLNASVFVNASAKSRQPAPVQFVAAALATHADIAKASALSPSQSEVVAAETSPVMSAANAASVSTSARFASTSESGRQPRQKLPKDDAGELRALSQGDKQANSILPPQGEITTQGKSVPATLQQLKAQALRVGNEVKPVSENQTLEVDFQFQRWSGDHSVKVSIPTEARREGNVTLLPSDVRAADALLRNMGSLTSLTPELLRSQKERDEQQQQRQPYQQQQDEEQE